MPCGPLALWPIVLKTRYSVVLWSYTSERIWCKVQWSHDPLVRRPIGPTDWNPCDARSIGPVQHLDWWVGPVGHRTSGPNVLYQCVVGSMGCITNQEFYPYHDTFLSPPPHPTPRPRATKLGVGGILGSLRPSVRPSVRPSRLPCPLSSTYSSGWIHFNFIHLIKQLKNVCRV